MMSEKFLAEITDFFKFFIFFFELSCNDFRNISQELECEGMFHAGLLYIHIF